MIWAAARVMLLALLRDRGALAMVFVLPPVMFLVFAEIMVGSDGSNLRLKLAVADLSGDPSGARLVQALEADDALRVVTPETPAVSSVRALVTRDAADAGIVVRGPLTGRDAPVLLIVDPSKPNTGPVLIGQLRRVLAEAMPDVALDRALQITEGLVGGFSTEQSFAAAAALEQVANDAGGPLGDDLIETAPIDPDAPGAVTYYAGAIVIMFLLFTAANGAMALIDEREAGVMSRLAVYSNATTALVLGKFVHFTVQGALQTALVFAVAMLVYGVDALANPGALILIGLTASAFAAAFGLAIAAVSGSKPQAAAIANFVILVFSALGGSMVPRYFMEPWLQELSWLTPNAWVIEAFRGAIGADAAVGEALALLGPVALGAAASLAVAVGAARRSVRVRAE